MPERRNSVDQRDNQEEPKFVRAPIHETQLKEKSIVKKGVSIIKEKIENVRN